MTDKMQAKLKEGRPLDTKPNGPTKTRAIRIPDSDWKKIKKAARLLGMSASELVRGAVIAQLEGGR